MSRPPASQLTPLELAIMKVLWEAGPANVQSVRDRLSEDRDLAYTTVQTMLNVLYKKGKVRRLRQGRAFEYAPVVSRVQAARQATTDLVKQMFDGSTESLVMSLVEARELSPETLARLTALVEEAEGESDGPLR